MNTTKILSAAVTAGFLLVTGHAHAAPPPHSVPKTKIRHIESYGTHAVVHYGKDVENDFDDGSACPGLESDFPEKIRSFYIDYNTAEGKQNYMLIVAAAAARKKTLLNASGCDGDSGLPVIDSVETRF